MLDRLWLRLWLAVFLATTVPLAAFLFLGVFLIQHSVENADIGSIGRQTRTLGAVVADQDPAERVATQAAVASVGRRLSILPINAIAGHLPDEAVSAIQTTGAAQGRVRVPEDYIFGAVRVGDQVVVVRRPYETPVLDWNQWLGRLLAGALLAATCAIVVSLFLARAIARPVDRVARASRALAQGETPESLPLEGPRELRSLARSFNSLSQELARSHAAEQAFLLSISHELRTPVAAVRGFAEGLQEGVIDTTKAATFIMAESGRLERLIGDLLDLARLRAGRFAVRPESLDLRLVARDAVERCRAAAESRTTRVTVTTSGASPAYADPDRTLQVASNLIENALRVSPENGVVTVETGPGLLAVTDDGPGLDAADLERAFDRYVVHDRHRTDMRRAGGVGLGLALVKELTEAMGGSVKAEPTPGGGATFTVSLPADALPTPGGSPGGSSPAT